MMKLRNKPLSFRFRVQLVILSIFFLGIIVSLQQLSHSLTLISSESIGNVMLEDKKASLKVSTAAVAKTLSELFPKNATEEQMITIIRKAISDIRYEKDKSGYFFVYKGTVNIAFPTAPQKQGKDLGGATDKNGVTVIKDLAKAAANGGGFVQYVWPKPGAGDQPKISYATKIPNTDFWIGTGVYLDNVAATQSKVSKVLSHRSTILTIVYTVVILAFFLGVLLPLSIAIQKSILLPVNKIKEAAIKLASGNIDITLLPAGDDELTRMEEAFCTMAESIGNNIKIAEAISQKDLTSEIKIQSEEDSFGLALKRMQQNLIEFVYAIKNASVQIDSGSSQLSDMSQSLASSSTEQAATVQEISSSLQNVKLKAQENETNSTEGEKLTEQQVTISEKGSEQMGVLENAITKMTDSSKEMSKITKVIDDLAFQTNLLALNAAVEAARAGQHGKGFAVVADEVRNLASRSAKAASEIATLINDELSRVEGGAEVAVETSKVLETIKNGSLSVSELVKSIATSSSEQAGMIVTINQAIIEIEKSTMNNSASSEETAATAEELSAQSAELNNLVSQFKIHQKSIQTVQLLSKQ